MARQKTSPVWILVKSSQNQVPRAIEYSNLVPYFKRSTDFRSPQKVFTALTITCLVSKSFSWIRGAQRTLNQVHTTRRKKWRGKNFTCVDFGEIKPESSSESNTIFWVSILFQEDHWLRKLSKKFLRHLQWHVFISKSFSWIRGTHRTLNHVHTTRRKNGTAKRSQMTKKGSTLRVWHSPLWFLHSRFR